MHVSIEHLWAGFNVPNIRVVLTCSLSRGGKSQNKTVLVRKKVSSISQALRKLNSGPMRMHQVVKLLANKGFRRCSYAFMKNFA
jgi:hypothetical protein